MIFVDRTIQDSHVHIIKKGNKVYDENGNPVMDGKYPLNIFKSIKVENGTVI